MKTKKTFHLRQELQLVCKRREFRLLAIPLFSPLYLQCTITAFPSAHSQPFVWCLIATSGAGEGRWGHGGTQFGARFDNSALSGPGCRQPRRWRARSTCASSSRAGPAARLQPLRTDVKRLRSADPGPQILILKGLIVEMSRTSAQNERRAFSF